MIRRAVVLLVVLGGAMLLEPLRMPSSDAIAPVSLLVFGVLLLAADTLGDAFHAAGLPKVVGYLAAGALLGPTGLRLAMPSVTTDLALIKDLAIGLIGLMAGAELKLDEVLERGRVILGMLTGQLLLGLVLLTGAVMAAAAHLPFTQGLTGVGLFAVALLFASVLTVNSPMVAIAMLKETGASGPVARTVLGVVLVADVIVVLLFTCAFALVQGTLGLGDAGGTGVVLGLVREIGGSFLAGVGVAVIATLWLRFVKLELVLFAVIVVFVTGVAARQLHFELLLSLLVAGFLVQNVARVRAEPLVHTLQAIADPVFVVFFALAGAELHLHEVVALWPVVLGFAAVRAVAIRVGAKGGARLTGADPLIVRYGWMGLVSQAGVALGLSAVVASRLGERGIAMQSVVVGIIAVNETIGPILFKRALVATGEAQR
jgi:Kef-type K+ transport system membrane component KefB